MKAMIHSLQKYSGASPADFERLAVICSIDVGKRGMNCSVSS